MHVHIQRHMLIYSYCSRLQLHTACDLWQLDCATSYIEKHRRLVQRAICADQWGMLWWCSRAPHSKSLEPGPSCGLCKTFMTPSAIRLQPLDGEPATDSVFWSRSCTIAAQNTRQLRFNQSQLRFNQSHRHGVHGLDTAVTVARCTSTYGRCIADSPT